MNRTTMNDVLPILNLMEGYAMANEPVMDIKWADVHDARGNHSGTEILVIHFPCGEMRKLQSGVWVLSVNGTPLATF
jgi:hypothetical protein